jgi:hypothetical protein
MSQPQIADPIVDFFPERVAAHEEEDGDAVQHDNSQLQTDTQQRSSGHLPPEIIRSVPELSSGSRE